MPDVKMAANALKDPVSNSLATAHPAGMDAFAKKKSMNVIPHPVKMVAFALINWPVMYVPVRWVIRGPTAKKKYSFVPTIPVRIMLSV